MSPETENIVQEALQMPREARAFLAEKLLESLDFEEPFNVSPEWKKEISRRCRELDEGLVDLVPGDEVLREARERLQGRNTGFIQRHGASSLNRRPTTTRSNEVLESGF